jgi:trehalose 6-phosphate phosphatase
MAGSGTEARPPLLKADAALYLDFDGTLAALAPHPDGVTIEAGLPELLVRVRDRLAGAVAIVTGRTLETLDALLGPLHFAGAGLHGLEWRLANGKTHFSGNPVGASRIAEALRERFGGDRRLVIEDKGASVALHYRRAPERAEACMAVMREVAAAPEFEILRGHFMVEARPRGFHKGAAVKTLQRHAPFSGRKPVFVGDDRTDEDGFRAALVHGGYGVKVGPEPSEARYRLASVAAVNEWLVKSLAALEPGAAR